MRWIALASCVLAMGTGTTARAQAPESGAFLTRLGRDTVGLERYRRTARSLTGELVGRAPRTTLRRYAIQIGPGGQAGRLEVTTYRAGDTAVVQRDITTITGDSAHVTRHRANGDTAFVVALPPGTIAVGPGYYAVFDEITRRAHPTGRDSVVMMVYPAGAPAPTRYVITRIGADSVSVASPNGAVHVRLDARGRPWSLYAAETTQKVTVDRIPSADITAIAAAWGQGGQLSPRDTVRATIGGASLLVDYGRPFKRGRSLFGGDIVPWNQVWRTGANAATQLAIDRDLVVGGTLVPAGKYSLWTLPGPRGWKLVINSETGQWGTAYNVERDFARVPANTAALPHVVEQFTIAIVPQGAGGAFQLEWDQLRVSIPFTVK
ncbi:MAG TPA: DUF2911 domain-containing protein [Gemmatimonadales bacterium]|jgi:hypothetical protein